MRDRERTLPMHVVPWILDILFDPRCSKTAIQVAAYIAPLGDENGDLPTDEAGNPVADYQTIASALGMGESTVHKALAALDEAGYLNWKRGRGSERLKGVRGRIHLNLTSAP